MLRNKNKTEGCKNTLDRFPACAYVCFDCLLDIRSRDLLRNQLDLKINILSIPHSCVFIHVKFNVYNTKALFKVCLKVKVFN